VEGMKTEHLTETKLCPKCGEFKPLSRSYWYLNITALDGWSSLCKVCKMEIERTYLNSPKGKETRRLYHKSGRKNEANKRWHKNSKDPEHPKKLERERLARLKKHDRKFLTNTYIKNLLKSKGIEVTLESIEFKRQQILMKRTLKQFKKWRKENESDNKHVPEEQRTNGEDNERVLQARADNTCTTGI